MISSPHSPLLAGARVNSVSARSPNFRVAAEARGPLSFERVTGGFPCSGWAANETPTGTTPHAKITALANPTRTVHLCWQIMFGESIVETAKTLRLPPCVKVQRRMRLEAPRVRPRNLGTKLHRPNFNEVTLMLKPIVSSVLALAIGLPLSAADNKKETERLENCGMILK